MSGFVLICQVVAIICSMSSSSMQKLLMIIWSKFCHGEIVMVKVVSAVISRSLVRSGLSNMPRADKQGTVSHVDEYVLVSAWKCSGQKAVIFICFSGHVCVSKSLAVTHV